MLTGSLGLFVMLLAALIALVADAVRQGSPGRHRAQADGPGRRRWVAGLTVAALALAAVGGVATLLRFAALT